MHGSSASPSHRRTAASLAMSLAAPAAMLFAACTSTVSSAPTDPPNGRANDTVTSDAPSTTEDTTTTVQDTTTTAPIVPTTLPPVVEAVPMAAGPIPVVGKSSGPGTVMVQDRLTQLGFWVGPSDGTYGFATTQAVMAFQKYNGLPANAKVDEGTAFVMSVMTERAHGTANFGHLVEVDKARQLLFLIVDGRTLWTFNTSTGSEKPYTAVNHKDPTQIESGDSVTPTGLWKVERERPDGWWEGDLGRIYRPKYFHGGVAIHGMTKVPNYPASHGCVRLSVPAMDFVWESGLVPVGTPVWVHE